MRILSIYLFSASAASISQRYCHAVTGDPEVICDPTTERCGEVYDCSEITLTSIRNRYKRLREIVLNSVRNQEAVADFHFREFLVEDYDEFLTIPTTVSVTPQRLDELADIMTVDGLRALISIYTEIPGFLSH